jgi:hypothetical protein
VVAPRTFLRRQARRRAPPGPSIRREPPATQLRAVPVSSLDSPEPIVNPIVGSCWILEVRVDPRPQQIATMRTLSSPAHSSISGRRWPRPPCGRPAPSASATAVIVCGRRLSSWPARSVMSAREPWKRSTSLGVIVSRRGVRCWSWLPHPPIESTDEISILGRTAKNNSRAVRYSAVVQQ